MPAAASTSAASANASNRISAKRRSAAEAASSVVHRRDAHDRLVLVDRPDRLANGGRERGRVAARAHDERHDAVREAPLRHRRRDVDRVRFAQRQRHLLHVAHHADDRVGRSVRRADAQALADRIGSREPALRERFADQRDQRSARAIVLVEQHGRAGAECASSRGSPGSRRSGTRCTSAAGCVGRRPRSARRTRRGRRSAAAGW